jgi:signal transduction histidine kinase
MNILPFFISLFLSHRLYKFSKVNHLNRWINPLNYARYFTGFLFAVQIILSASNTTRWFWHIFLISLLLFAYQQKEMRPLRFFLLAFAPFVAVAVLSDLTEIILNEFYTKWTIYFKNARLLSLIWLGAILFSQERQQKAEEKERIKRQKEDEINRAIAARKVELEGLVEERTAEILNQKKELEQTLHELKSTQNQLIQSEKMASLGELTAGIAHEIQNPLNFVNNFSEINSELIDELKQELENGDKQLVEEIANDIKENEQKILQHGKRAESIVKGMLLHSRGKSGKKELTDINALCDEYLRLSYHGFRAKDKSFNAIFKIEIHENLPKVKVVPQEIGRVLLNLINNAFFAVNEKQKSGMNDYKPTVVVHTNQIKNNIEIRVQDNGNGIPEQIKDKIFQPFFTTKSTGKGTGLGLSISYDIIANVHSGDIRVESKEKQGTEFIITLPIEL